MRVMVGKRHAVRRRDVIRRRDVVLRVSLGMRDDGTRIKYGWMRRNTENANQVSHGTRVLISRLSDVACSKGQVD